MDGVEQEAERLLASGALGRSSQLVDLFGYLVSASARNRPPKETEIAHHVFGRDAAFEPAQDALVRVHVHRLRTKLERYYADHPGPGGSRLAIPKGEYRVVLEEGAPRGAVAPPDKSAEVGGRAWPWRPIALGLALACLVLAVMLALRGGDPPVGDPPESPLWDGFRRDSRTALIIAGDRPGPFGAQSVGDSTILPVGVATALRHVIPALASGDPARQRLRLLPMSQVTPDMMRAANIIYVGQIADIAMLGEPLFAGSRIRPGKDGRSLVDRRTDRVIAQAPDEHAGDPLKQSDFGYIASFAGPSGNRIVVIAGGGNAGLMQAAEVAAAVERVRPIMAKAGGNGDFEAVLVVTSLHDMNMGSRLILSAPLDSARIWREGTTN